MDWKKVPPRERDAMVAESLGYRIDRTGDTLPVADELPRIIVFNESGSHWAARIPVPHYTTDHNAARLIEDEIERRGLINAYLLALGDLVCSINDLAADMDGQRTLWRLLRATPDQRCQAAVMVLQPSNSQKP